VVPSTEDELIPTVFHIDAIPFYKFAYQILIAQGLGDTHNTHTHTECVPSELLIKVMSECVWVCVFFVWPSHTMKIGMSREVKRTVESSGRVRRRRSCSAGT